MHAPAAPAVPLVVQREIDLDLPADELWRLIGTADGWREWMVDQAAVAVAAGAVGEVVDDGVRRAVRVREVVEGRSVSFHWAQTGRGDDLSSVTLEIVERPDGARRLRITEQFLSPQACAVCPLRTADRWDLRACLLCVAAASTCPV